MLQKFLEKNEGRIIIKKLLEKFKISFWENYKVIHEEEEITYDFMICRDFENKLIPFVAIHWCNKTKETYNEAKHTHHQLEEYCNQNNIFYLEFYADDLPKMVAAPTRFIFEISRLESLIDENE